MKFRTQIPSYPSHFSIHHQQKIFTIGSCFVENISEKLHAHKFKVLHNPFGILFHPIAIENALLRIYDHQLYHEKEIFKNKNLYHSWDHHSSYSKPTQEETLSTINQSLTAAHTFLRNTNVAIITLGTSFMYTLKALELPVANCHKVPNFQFRKELISTEDVVKALQNCVYMLKDISEEKIQVLFTVSPVRHLKDGMIENNRSKAILLEAVHQIVEKKKDCHYFPSYEIMMDDLRDYRFYTKDLLHPNSMAKQYIWEQFSKTYFSEVTQIINKELITVQQQLNHKPKFPNSIETKNANLKLVQKLKDLSIKYPNISFAQEIEQLTQ